MNNRSDGTSSALTVNIEPGAVAGSPGPVSGRAGVETAVLRLGPADVDVADHLPVHRDVLPHHEPGNKGRYNSQWLGGIFNNPTALRPELFVCWEY